MLNRHKNLRSSIVVLTVLSLVFAYFTAPSADAASMTHAKDALSTSQPGVAATSTFTFTIDTPLSVGEYYEVNFFPEALNPAHFTNIATSSVTCADSASTTKTVIEDMDIVRCTATAAIASGTKTLIVANHTNPSANVYTIRLSTKQADHDVIEMADVMVAIVSTVTVSATVNSSLTFAISTVASSTNVNGVLTTSSTTNMTQIAFGDLTTLATSTIAQQLAVTTNAAYGYSVTVQQNQDLRTGNGATINAFPNGVPGAPAPWVNPTGTLGNDLTWGHFGLTSDDSGVFGANNLQGFNGASPITIMSNGGPSDGSTQNVGMAKVAYSVMVTGLQEAGDYSNALTYICTPEY